MSVEPQIKPGWMAAMAPFLAVLILYLLSWGPVGALAARWRLDIKPFAIAYYPVDWAVWHCPGAYEPLKWYWDRFDFLRCVPHSRAHELIETSDQVRDIPAIWEKVWQIHVGPPGFREASPFRTHGGVI